MYLTREEEDMLAGKLGSALQKSMEILVGLGECYDAERMVPITSGHFLSNLGMIGEAGASFVEDLATGGGRFRVTADTNPSSVDPDEFRDFGITEEFAAGQAKLSQAFAQMGALLSDTCTPYLVGHVPRLGEHIAWNESSAIVFANSVLGARCNREGGPSALAAALAGRTPEYGYHLDANRHGDLRIIVKEPLHEVHDYATLGFFAGGVAGDRSPVFGGIPLSASWDDLKMLGACCASAGSVALFHTVGLTPEAPTEQAAFGERGTRGVETAEYGEKQRRQTEEFLDKARGREVDVVGIGCPHASITEIREVARLLSGRKVKSALWIATSRMVRTYAEFMGYADIIRTAGGRITCHTCPVSGNRGFLEKLGFRTMATNSAKLAYAIAQGTDLQPHYGSLARCVDAAVTGIWECT